MQTLSVRTVSPALREVAAFVSFQSARIVRTIRAPFAAVRRNPGFCLPMVAALLALSCMGGGSTASAQEAFQWTWMGGSSSPGAFAVYGTKGTPAAGNIPGSRDYASTWTDSSGHLWLFGGFGYISASSYFNDLWEFDPSTNQWAWMSGSSGYNQSGVYGTLGTPAAANAPGGRYGASSWTDSSGHLWLFGGYGYDFQGSLSYLNDLWEFDPSTNQWIWMAGSSSVNQYGQYGTTGTPAAGNTPGARLYASSWTDSSGNLWLFGGDGLSASAQRVLNDLWEFKPATGEWTWIGGSSSGNQPGVYGTEGTPAAGNVPGSREYATTWTDSSGNPWLFGGYGLSASAQGFLNDLWEFNFSTSEWTWMAGSSSVNQFGQYGTLGTPAAGNTPGARFSASSWYDSNGKLWLFGGYGYYGNYPYNLLNDLWLFDPATNEWAWRGGKSSLQPGQYGTLGTPGAENIPGGRYGTATWTDGGSHYWLFGGYGSGGETLDIGELNDLWVYQLSPDQPPAVSLSATSLAFNSVGVGESGTTQSVTLTNSGGLPLTISSISVTGANASSFVFTNNCGTSLASLASCTIQGYFAPTATGALAAAITIADNATGSPQSVALSGTGAPPPAVTLSAPSIYFGSVGVGGATYSSVRLTNSGGSPLLFSSNSITVTGANASSFSVYNYCGAPLPAGDNCTFYVYFTPKTTGAFTAAVAISDNAAGSPQTITLSGTGVTPATASLSATSLSFGSVRAGGSSASQSVTLTNTGALPLYISYIAVIGANSSSFDFANNCGYSLAAGANCSIHGHFTPATAGSFSATIEISGSPQTIALSGTGIGNTTVSLSPASLSFGSVSLGGSSASQSVTLTNTGAYPFSITSIGVTGADASSFGFTNNCGSILASGANCSIHGHFAPTATGALTAAVTIIGTATNSPQTIALSGTGLVPPAVSLSATSLAFGSVEAGSTSATQQVTLTNTGGSLLTITGIAVTGSGASSFGFTNNCGASLAAGANCTIHGHFAPTTSGPSTATITIFDNASGPQSIALSGAGAIVPTTVSLSATSLSFGTVPVGSGSGTQTVTLTNTGTTALAIYSVAVTGANATSFVFGNTCGSSLAPGYACTIHGHFAPTATGPLTATITITDTATGSPQSIALSGTGQ
jgi:N-acetylneuraminic acid mutarotase